MKTYATMILLLVGSLPVFAADSYLAESKAAYETIQANLLKSAEKMPEDGYSFQPTKEQRTFAELIAHIADAQKRICSASTGTMKQVTPTKSTSKSELIAALKSSNEECNSDFAALTPENASSMVKMGKNERTRLGTMIYNTTHDNESYGTLVVYLRLKGIVPPSSEK